MGKKLRFLILILLVLCSGFFVKKMVFKTKIDDLINISELSEEFMDNYFEKISDIKSDTEKENMLIVISKNKIKNSYGAKEIIEAPNNQYILQYNSLQEKNDALEKLKEDKSIYSVEENTVYTIESTDYNSWGVEKMSLDYAITTSNIEKLKNVTVAIIDTGCDLTLFNKYYSGKIVEYYNVLEQSNTSMVDENGHGTHIAGTIAESTPSNVKILPIKVSTNGRMYSTDIVAAINYITYDKKADVINMSYGSYYLSTSEEEAIIAANKKNIISVAAAGNDNSSQNHYPSAFDETIAIASIDSSLKKSSFSNYGSYITFAAPGTDIKSIMGTNADISKRNGNNDDDDHEIISGTSMATPHAASAVAILKSYNKGLTLDNVIEILKKTAIDLGTEGWDKYYGHGLISFDNVKFCDNSHCDEYGVYKDENISEIITKIELTELKLTNYNYYSLTNIIGSKIKVYYADDTSEEMLLENLPNLEILNYDPVQTSKQNITIKTDDVSINVEITNPPNYENGWEYNVLENNEVELTGYKNHGLYIDKLYIPETIDSKKVVSFADNVKLSDFGKDFDSYKYLYLPSSFKRIGSYALSNSSFKYVLGDCTGVEVGSHAFEKSSIVKVDAPITKLEDSAFKDDYELISVIISSSVHEISDYAFENCKKLTDIHYANDNAYHYIERVGKYAFFYCISLSNFELNLFGDIEEFAFAYSHSLITLNLSNVDSIATYAFYESGISEVSFGPHFEVVNESSFENCRNLKEVELKVGRIESKAFFNSSVESIYIGSQVEYIADDAFAYSQIKKSNGDNDGTGTYKSVSGLGIVESATNKLIIGYTNASGVSNTNIPGYITEIGDYAYTGNNTLYKIAIPSNVTKIGKYAFKDCYQLSDVYLLGDNIVFDDDTFKRTYEGEIKDTDLKIYIHNNNSTLKQYIINKNLEYRYIEPDEVIVTDDKKTYDALSQVEQDKISVKLIYHEEEDREELVYPEKGVPSLLNNVVGYYIEYQTSYNFRFGDTYYVVHAKNALGYEVTKNVEVKVSKLTPTYTIPTNLTGNLGQKLSEITLPSGFEWMNGDEVIQKIGNVKFKAKYIPTDTINYETIENIDITVLVSSDKNVIIPSITLNNKTYDGTKEISESDISISNLDTSEYSIISAVSSSADAGLTTATIKLKLSDNKFEEYSFDNGKQTKEFIINFEILKANIYIKDSSKDVTIEYDGLSHSIEMDLDYNSGTIIKYINENNEYELNELPKYTEIGTYIIKYKAYIDDNHTEYFGQKTLIIEQPSSYAIKKYSVDETNKYISKISINTEEDIFKSNFILNQEYKVNVDYKEVNDKKLIYTGGKTRITRGEELYREFTNIVFGDTNGDAKINYLDYVNVYNHIQKTKHPESSKKLLENEYLKAADMSEDDKINYLDYVRIYNKIKELKGGTN